LLCNIVSAGEDASRERPGVDNAGEVELGKVGVGARKQADEE